MSNKQRTNSSQESRRSFIKTKVLGGFLLALGYPFLSKARTSTNNNTPLPMPKPGGDKEVYWSTIRSYFSFPSNKHYFNTASLGPSPDTVVNAETESIRGLAKRALSGHEEMEQVHKVISSFFNAEPDEIALTRNATEGMNSVAWSLPLEPGDEIILSKHEHIGGSAPWLALQKAKGVVVKVIDLDLSGKDNIQLLKKSITENTKVISISHITCTTGLMLPVKKIVKLCRDNNIFSVIDGAQAVGMINIDLKDMNPDFYIGSGHKWLFGPKATGILYINKNVIGKCNPTYVGAYSDSKFDLNNGIIEFRDSAQRVEYGTRSSSAALGLKAAVDFINEIGIDSVESRGRELAAYFHQKLGKDKNIEILTPTDAKCSAAIVTVRIKNKVNQDIRNQLSWENNMPTRLIYENGINGIRLSFAIYNSKEEIDELAKTLVTKANE